MTMTQGFKGSTQIEQETHMRDLVVSSTRNLAFPFHLVLPQIMVAHGTSRAMQVALTWSI